MLAPPNCVAGQVLRTQRPTLPTPFFFHCVTEAIDAIEDAAPDAIAHVTIGVEEVPDVSDLWGSHVPLAYATQADETHLAQVILYRRPIELRSHSRDQLRILVFSALVEQISTVTGILPDSLDPDNLRGE